nr:glucan 1,3-beta-glucosidase [Quercus suber]
MGSLFRGLHDVVKVSEFRQISYSGQKTVRKLPDFYLILRILWKYQNCGSTKLCTGISRVGSRGLSSTTSSESLPSARIAGIRSSPTTVNPAGPAVRRRVMMCTITVGADGPTGAGSGSARNPRIPSWPTVASFLGLTGIEVYCADQDIASSPTISRPTQRSSHRTLPAPSSLPLSNRASRLKDRRSSSTHHAPHQRCIRLVRRFLCGRRAVSSPLASPPSAQADTTQAQAEAVMLRSDGVKRRSGVSILVDGWSLGASYAHDKVLKPHWDQWVTLEDFKKIKQYGFNVVRIPIGFWAYDNANTPYAQGAAPYMDKAIAWAREVGLKVIIDLHGAPGSQNGFDNSGHKMNTPQWQISNNVERTLAILENIQKKYGASSYDDVVAGIELLNEPFTPSLDADKVKQFTRDGYNQQRTISQSRVVIFEDGFQDPSTYNGFLTPSDHNAQNVAVDHHEYQVFNDTLVAMQPWEHRQLVCNNAYVYSGADKWTFVGEWTGAMTDCAGALNGYNIGARYDGTYPGSKYVGSCANINAIETWSQTLKDDTRGYIEAQLDMFEKHTQGWVFWVCRLRSLFVPFFHPQAPINLLTHSCFVRLRTSKPKAAPNGTSTASSKPASSLNH